MYGDFLIHGDEPFTFERCSFRQSQCFNTPSGALFRPVIARTDRFGHELIAWDPEIGWSSFPAHALVATSEHNLGRSADLEVLYVGQAQGKKGDRLAVDRLLAHTTLQRILADSAHQKPLDEVLVLMFRFENSRNIISTAGDFSIEPIASKEEEHEHLLRMGDVRLDRRNRITIAEAALINYFKPEYNVVHRNSFHSSKNRKLETLKKLLAADFTALMVELNTENIGCKIFTPSTPARRAEDIFPHDMLKRLRESSSKEAQQCLKEMTHMHVAKFALYDKKERETFVDSLPWGDGAAV